MFTFYKVMRHAGVYVRRGVSGVQTSHDRIRRILKCSDGDVFEDMRTFTQEFISIGGLFRREYDMILTFPARMLQATYAVALRDGDLPVPVGVWSANHSYLSREFFLLYSLL